MKIDKKLLRLTGNLRLYLLATSALGLLGGLLVIGQALSLSRIIDGVYLGGAGLAALQGWLLLLLAALTARSALTWASDVVASRSAARAKGRLRAPFFAHLLALGPRFSQGERSGELSNVAGEGVESLDAYFSQYMPQLFVAILVPMAVLVAVTLADPLSGLVLFLTLPLLPFFMFLVGKMADAVTRRQWRTLGTLSAHFLDVLQGLTTLKLFNRSGIQREKLAQITEQHRAATLGVLRVAFLSALVLEIGATISTAIIAVEVGLRLLYASIPFAPALFVLLLAPEFYAPFRALGARFHAAMSGGEAARRILEIMDKPAITTTTPYPHSPCPNLSATPIVFRNVSFSYGESGPDPSEHRVPALRNFFCVRATASYCQGKTTVLK